MAHINEQTANKTMVQNKQNPALRFLRNSQEQGESFDGFMKCFFQFWELILIDWQNNFKQYFIIAHFQMASIQNWI
jgi:hypothetical protein